MAPHAPTLFHLSTYTRRCAITGTHGKGPFSWSGATWAAIIVVLAFVVFLCYVFGTNEVFSWIGDMLDLGDHQDD